MEKRAARRSPLDCMVEALVSGNSIEIKGWLAWSAMQRERGSVKRNVVLVLIWILIVVLL